MVVRGWLIVGAGASAPRDGSGFPPGSYVGDYVGALPHAANFQVGQWLHWRPVPAMEAGALTMMIVVCVEVPVG